MPAVCREWERLAQLYRELEADVASRGLTCRGCGECCRFDRVDHLLYASDLEREYLLHTMPVPAHAGEYDVLIARGQRCPFQVNGVCQAREGRVLGCRLHFCEGSWGEGEQEWCEAWHDRVKKLHAECGLVWNYRPLLPL